MKAIIPVAGIGTRLRPHTHTAPKVLLPVAGKPMIAHILDELVSMGLKEVTFIIGYKGDMIRDYVTGPYSFKANFVEQSEMRGLGHAISLAKEHHYSDADPVLIVLGDTIFHADLRGVFEKGESAIGVKKVNDARRFGIVELDKRGEVKRLIEKPENPPTNLAIVGIYYMANPKLLFDSLDELIEEGKTTKGEFQLTDALQKMLDAGEHMRVFMVDGWYDCGKPETMLLTNRDLLDKQNMGATEHTRVSERYPGSVMIMPVAIAESVVIENSIVGPYVSVSAETVLRECIVKNTIIGEHAEVSSIILEDSIISDNAKAVGTQFRLNVGDSSEIVLD
jgi:glucose-1-phosphate thymidylyltransferase